MVFVSVMSFSAVALRQSLKHCWGYALGTCKKKKKFHVLFSDTGDADRVQSLHLLIFYQTHFVFQVLEQCPVSHTLHVAKVFIYLEVLFSCFAMGWLLAACFLLLWRLLVYCTIMHGGYSSGRWLMIRPGVCRQLRTTSVCRLCRTDCSCWSQEQCLWSTCNRAGFIYRYSQEGGLLHHTTFCRRWWFSPGTTLNWNVLQSIGFPSFNTCTHHLCMDVFVGQGWISVKISCSLLNLAAPTF